MMYMGGHGVYAVFNYQSVCPWTQEGDSVGLSGGKGLNKAIQLKQKLLEFDQTRYAWHVL